MSKVTNGTFYIMLVDLRNIYAFFLGDGFVSWLKDPDIDVLREFLMNYIPYSSVNLHDLLNCFSHHPEHTKQSTPYNFLNSLLFVCARQG